MKVLLVEDDMLIGIGIGAGLRPHGIQVNHVPTVDQALLALKSSEFHALVLDLGLPDRDGLTLLDEIRALGSTLPVLILSARDAIEHRLTGLHRGADDYIVKPFDLRELAARLDALVRRTRGRPARAMTIGALRLDPESGSVWLDNKPVALSRREIDLLTDIASANGYWVSSQILNERLYGMGTRVGSNSLNVHIHNIRRKLGPDAIETARGLGFRLGKRIVP